MITNQNKILITGASGYLGRNLCKYFYERGYFVIAQTRNTNNEELKSISHKQVLLEDIFDFEIDYLIHNLSITQYFGEWSKFEKVNIELSKKIFNYFRSKSSVYVSSISVFGYTRNLTMIDENSPRLDLNSPYIDMYSKSKIIVEDYIFENNLNVSIIRPGLIYGNKQKSNVRQIFSKDTTVPLVEINKLCEAFEKILLSEKNYIVNAVDQQRSLRIDFEKDNPNTVILPNFIFELAKNVFKSAQRRHQLNMINRQNEFDNKVYRKLIQ